MYYIVYDDENVNENLIYGIFTSEEAADEAVAQITETLVEGCFAVDPEESGLDPKNRFDRKMVYKECRASIGVKKIESLNTLYNI